VSSGEEEKKSNPMTSSTYVQFYDPLIDTNLAERVKTKRVSDFIQEQVEHSK
jgi:hypothetical protein